jgi:hypothetical protein
MEFYIVKELLRTVKQYSIRIVNFQQTRELIYIVIILRLTAVYVIPN